MTTETATAYNVSTIFSAICLHCSSVMYSLLVKALAMAMVCMIVCEFTHTFPFMPTTHSNLK